MNKRESGEKLVLLVEKDSWLYFSKWGSYSRPSGNLQHCLCHSRSLGAKDPFFLNSTCSKEDRFRSSYLDVE
ncbi:hypothetical protein MRB53_004616 [Persea americana]|uniref:Uncharacterized protein n=1 Tax=Persea americana TaxID=3435 RepID=A0ACC2MBR4_PERAE|nr:hypothetical protein MRB53_004616 [Persea americana]